MEGETKAAEDAARSRAAYAEFKAKVERNKAEDREWWEASKAKYEPFFQGGRDETPAEKAERETREAKYKAFFESHKRESPEARAEREAREAIEYKEQYETWNKSCERFFVSYSTPFPDPPKYNCNKQHCVKAENLGPGVCHHGVEKLLKGSGECSEKWLKKERLRWHPDRFTTGQELALKAQEVFQLIQRLIDGGREG